MRRPAKIARISPFTVPELSRAAPVCFALNASALQTIETTISARPAAISPNGLPSGAMR